MDLVEDFEIEKYATPSFENRAFMNKWISDVREKIQKKGNEVGTENSYVSTLAWVISKIYEVYGLRLDISGNNWSRNQKSDQLIVPDHSLLIEKIKGFVPTNENESKAFKYIVVGLLTGARYSDIASWTRKENVVELSGRKYLTYIPQKTQKKRINIPFNPLLESVLGEKNLLPNIPYTTLTRYVKEVFRKMGFDRKVISIRKIGNKKIVREIPEYELMGTHRVRASAITGFLQNGMSETEAKSFSGHSANSRSFERYVDFSQSHLDSVFNEYSKQFQ